MKKILILFVAFVLLVGMGLILPSKKNEYDYLRLHIRANSNDSVDQSVKYEIKSELVNFLTPYLCQARSKNKAIDTINQLKKILESKCDNILKHNGLNYTSNIKINNEYFPTRNYDNITLSAGYYDAVIVELGQAVGDNWWCVMYPPLCFVNKFENSMQIKYKSKIAEWFSSVFN